MFYDVSVNELIMFMGIAITAPFVSLTHSLGHRLHNVDLNVDLAKSSFQTN